MRATRDSHAQRGTLPLLERQRRDVMAQVQHAQKERAEAQGIRIVQREPHEIDANPENAAYLGTKRDKLGHFLRG